MPTTVATVSPSANEEEETMAMADQEKDDDDMYIPEEIVMKILQLSSLTFLAKGNCVCKLWRSHISSKSFLLQPSRTSLPLQHGFFVQLRVPTFLTFGLSIHFLPTSSATILHNSLFPDRLILASSNGLLLCLNRCQFPAVQYSVWNPISNSLIPIPLHQDHFDAVNIAFHSHDSVSFLILRFGYFQFRSWGFEVFSSETGQWRRQLLNPAAGFSLRLSRGPPAAVLNGVFYWLLSPSIVCSLDLLNNEFFEFPPEETECRCEVFSRCLAVAGGAVLMASTDGVVIEIWVVRERARSWGLKCRLSVECLIHDNADVFRASSVATATDLRILGIVGFQPWDSERIYLNTTDMVVCCDVGSGKVEIVQRFDGDFRCADVSDMVFFPYQSNLIE